MGISVPPTAELIRNIMMATLYVQDHVVHFYHLQALDWVDVVNALKADPKKTAELAQSFSSWHKNTPAYFADVQDTVKKLAASGLGIFANGLGPSDLQAAARGELAGGGALKVHLPVLVSPGDGGLNYGQAAVAAALIAEAAVGERDD